MNMLVIEHGPEISMPGVARSFGTGGTFQSPPLAALDAGAEGSRPCLRAWASRSSRLRAQGMHPRAELVVQPQEVGLELGGEEGGRALHGRDLHPLARGGSGVRRHWRRSVRLRWDRPQAVTRAPRPRPRQSALMPK